MSNILIPEGLNALIQQYLTDGMMEVSCLRYDGKKLNRNCSLLMVCTDDLVIYITAKRKTGGME